MRSRRLLRRLNKRGDTIIEVLMAIAIVSAVLGGAFVSANRSLNGMRVSQERSQAVKLAQGQAELLSAATKDTTASTDIFSNVKVGSEFFLNTNLSRGGSPRTTDGIYTIFIRREATNTFIVITEWRRSGSGTPEQVFIRYRAYPNP